jgi:AcrR family transcriptional regulator
VPRDGGEARAKILECAEELVRRKGANAVTVEAVAKAAGSAKGLVHYHFKTKKGLLSAVAGRLSQSRIESWSAAFESESPNQAIDQSWKLLAEGPEAIHGVGRKRIIANARGRHGASPNSGCRRSRPFNGGSYRRYRGPATGRDRP